MRQRQLGTKLGPWFATYAHKGGMSQTGVRVNLASHEANISGGLKGHPGVIIGLRWRHPRDSDRQFSWLYPRP
jgi:hypothetical protein